MYQQDQSGRITEAMEQAYHDLDQLRQTAASAAADAKRTHATALLAARAHGYSSREERDAYANLQAADAQEAADIAERTYRDTLTYIRMLTAQLDLARTRMVTERQIRV